MQRQRTFPKRITFDPRPIHLRHTSKSEKQQFVGMVQHLCVTEGSENMWSKLVEFVYPNYELMQERKQELKSLIKGLEQNLAHFTDVPLNTEDAIQ